MDWYVFGMKLILNSFEKYIRNGSIKEEWTPRFQRLCLYLRNQVARGIRQRDRDRRVRLTVSVYKYTRVSFSMPSHVTIHFPTGVLPDILILPDNPHFVLYVHATACVQLGFSIAFPRLLISDSFIFFDRFITHFTIHFRINNYGITIDSI